MDKYGYVNSKRILVGVGVAKCLTDEYNSTDVLNIKITDEVFNNWQMYIYKDGEIILDPDYEAKAQAKEAERIAKLYLTGADVERGIYQAIKMDFDDIINMVETLKHEQGDAFPIDIKALKIELKANHFYRGNPYVDAVGKLLGFTQGMLDMFFETNDYTYLLINNVEELETDTDSETPSDEAEGGVAE